MRKQQKQLTEEALWEPMKKLFGPDFTPEDLLKMVHEFLNEDVQETGTSRKRNPSRGFTRSREKISIHAKKKSP